MLVSGDAPHRFGPCLVCRQHARRHELLEAAADRRAVGQGRRPRDRPVPRGDIGRERLDGVEDAVEGQRPVGAEKGEADNAGRGDRVARLIRWLASMATRSTAAMVSQPSARSWLIRSRSGITSPTET